MILFGIFLWALFHGHPVVVLFLALRAVLRWPVSESR